MTASRPSRGARRSAATDLNNPDPIRVLVAMEARLDREALAAMLRTQPGFEVLGCVGTSQEVISRCLSLRPDVLILGVLLAWPREVAAVDAVRMCSPETRVLAIAPHTADRCAVLYPATSEADCCSFQFSNGTCLISALAHGAAGAFHRDVAPEELFEAVRTVAKGERWIEPGIELPKLSPIPLSKQERLVSLMVGGGKSNKEIAASLRISEATVKKHIGHVLHKLGMHDRLQLGLCVVRHPLIFQAE